MKLYPKRTEERRHMERYFKLILSQLSHFSKESRKKMVIDLKILTFLHLLNKKIALKSYNRYKSMAALMNL